MIMNDYTVLCNSHDASYTVNLTATATQKEFLELISVKNKDIFNILFQDKLPPSLQISNIFYSDKPNKECVVLVFKDGSKIIQKMQTGDTFDLNIGVALAFMSKVYGSKTQYHKMIQKKVSSARKKQ